MRGASLEQALSAFLLQYRITPHTTTGGTPSTLLLGRDLRTRLDLLRPDLQKTVRERHGIQKKHHDRGARDYQFEVGQKVWVFNFRPGPKWVSGTVVEVLGPVSYTVATEWPDMAVTCWPHTIEWCPRRE